MAKDRIFTDEDREWLIENYPHLSNTACIRALKCGKQSLQKLVAECGLEYHNQTKPNTKFIAKKKRDSFGMMEQKTDAWIAKGMCKVAHALRQAEM